MKKALLTVISLVLFVCGGIDLFQEPLWEFAKSKIIADMFVDGQDKRLSARAVLAYAKELLN